MRDLTSRLREIIRQNPPAARPSAPARELTYEADLDGDHRPEDVASGLGGVLYESASGTCVVVDRCWDEHHWHGRHRVGRMAPASGMPLGLFDPRCAGLGDWAERVVFFDIETTGLSGGAGTLAFLAGCGWFENGDFRVRQFFLNGPSGERPMLEALADIFARASLLVTYNGRTFDVPTMETRWAFHRTACPTDELPHFDMLPPARRLWARPSRAGRGRGGRGFSPGGVAGAHGGRGNGGRGFSPGGIFSPGGTGDPDGSCSLTALERSMLGFQRIGDVPGFEIPARYFHFLRTGDATAVTAVLEHNRLDLLSLAAVTTHALSLGAGGPDACRDAGEQLGLGRLYDRAGDLERAIVSYERAASGVDPDVRLVALARLGEALRRADRHEAAAVIWQDLLGTTDGGSRVFTRLERRAAEALAIHYEHRVKDPAEARRYAELLRHDAAGRQLADAQHRLGRLSRKVTRSRDTKGGPSAAPFIFER